MKKLFTAIRRGNVDEVASILDRKPELIACLAKAPPKKDDGQSPLMVAVKSDNLEVAHLLLDRRADVNFQDAVNPYGSNFSAPIWYDAVVQCFLRAGDHVSEKRKERTKGYFLLLRRLLDMGMDPNRKTSYGLNAWQHALEQYEQFARKYYPSYYVEESKMENRQLREMLKAVLDELLKHGADIHDFIPPNAEGLSQVSVILRNLNEGRELLDGLYGLDPDSNAFKPYTMKYRGKEQLITPSLTVEDYRQMYEIKWRELEPVLRAYYN
ncbi:MAG: ankyrin repeat domain-containing protein [Dysosmobacter sp.]|nr:ankyrin repeat domain-containing protein [Dysosmobacter sp.]